MEKPNIDLYNQVSKFVMKQRELIAHADTSDDIYAYTSMSAGFLEGLRITGTITNQDVNTYMSTLIKFAQTRESDLNAKNKISRNRPRGYCTAIHCQMQSL